MHIEATRLITTWLTDDLIGVNTMLPLVPKQADDKDPPDVTIYNDVDYDVGETALGISPPRVPSLVVVADERPDTSDTAKKYRSGHQFQMIVGVGYYAEKGAKYKAIIAADYTLRAVAMTLERGLKLPQAQREANKLLIMQLLGYETERAAGGVGASVLLGMLFATISVLNKAP